MPRDKKSQKDRRRTSKMDLHFLNQDGMVACNPRDKEAAHRAVVESIASENPKAVTCNKCLSKISKEARQQFR